MKTQKFLQASALLGFVVLAATQVSCLDQMYDGYKGPKLPDGVAEFGFQTRSDVKLKVSYHTPVQALIKVYAEDPMLDGVLKAGVVPVFAAYTSIDGSYDGAMYVPTSMKEGWLYTDCYGLPQSVKLSASQGVFTYDIDAPTKSSRAETRNILSDYFVGDRAPYDLYYSAQEPTYLAFTGGAFALQALLKWTPMTAPVSGATTLTKTDGLASESVSDIATRVFDHIAASNDKKSFLRDADVTNISISEDGTELSVVFCGDRAAFNNTVGYYYYKTGNAPSTLADWHKLPKFVMFPNASTQSGGIGLSIGETAALQFFGEDYRSVGTAQFPAGYSVGWFFIADAMNIMNYSYPRIERTYVMDPAYNPNPMFFSNDQDSRRRFISVQDAKSGILVLGFEDQPVVNAAAEDYSDVLFYVKSNKDISNPDRPEVPDPDDSDKDQSVTVEGTLCFEDIWPAGGDYDMNDVAIQYSRTFTFDKENNVKQIVEKFKPVQPNGSASYVNYFAYRAENLGSVTLPAECTEEAQTKSIVITQSVKDCVGQEFTIVRKFTEKINVEDAKKDFDPYIIVDGYSTEKRKEVHLPKQKPTVFADKSLSSTLDDAYYMNINGMYAFAIDIPVLNFKLATERARIDSEGEYPNFAKWATSKGTQYQDWYKK